MLHVLLTSKGLSDLSHGQEETVRDRDAQRASFHVDMAVLELVTSAFLDLLLSQLFSMASH